MKQPATPIAPRVVLYTASLVFIVFLILTAGGCSTIAGIGRDLQGMYDGMNHAFDTNGNRVPSGR